MSVWVAAGFRGKLDALRCGPYRKGFRGRPVLPDLCRRVARERLCRVNCRHSTLTLIPFWRPGDTVSVTKVTLEGDRCVKPSAVYSRGHAHYPESRSIALF